MDTLLLWQIINIVLLLIVIYFLYSIYKYIKRRQ